MKIAKKLSALLLTLCLLLPSFSIVAEAADGRISFTDPQTAVGEMVEVKCVARSTSGSFGGVEIKLTYDTNYLRFDSGENVKDDGNGTLTVTGQTGVAESTTLIKFQALKEGSTKVGISGATATDGNGLSLELDQGSSAVTIAAGDPSKITETGNTAAGTAEDTQVEVNGKPYTLTDDFADTDIPNGYSRTQVTLDGKERQMVENESGKIKLAYLKESAEAGDFFLYNEENASFSPYEEVFISDSASIIILSDTSKVDLPDTYQEAKLTLNEKEFPVWQDSEHEGYYVMYAMNNNGEVGYYQYDSQEGTYQRFEVTAPEEEKKPDNSLMGKVQEFISTNIQKIVLFGGLGLILILLIIIVLATKLRHRNAELDDLYEEYGIDEEVEEPVKPAKAAKAPKKEKKFGKKKKYDEDDFEEYEDDEYEDDFEEEEYDEYEDDDFDEEEYEDDFEEESYNVAAAIDQEAFTAYDSRSAVDELSIDDLDDLLSERPVKRRSHMEEDDTFKVDFIDLD